MRRTSAFTLIETLVACGLVITVLVLFTAAFVSSTEVWRRSSGVSLAETQLQKARSFLENDLVLADFAEMSVTPSTASFAGIPAGTAIWFLSAEDPATGEMKRTADGRALWQRNVLIYPAVPTSHQATFGVACAGGGGSGLSSDIQCPHKILIRKVIDSSVAHPDIAGAEGLMSASQIANYLTRPAGYDTTALAGESGVEEVSILCHSLLYLEIATTPSAGGGEVLVDLRTLDIESAGREVKLGQVPLDGNRFAIQEKVAIYPRN